MKKHFLLPAITLVFCVMLLTSCGIPNYFISDKLLEQGNVSFDQGKYQEAVVQYDQAIKANEYNAVAYGNKAAALIFLEKNEEALEAADKALEIAPREATLYLNRGDALNGLGDYEKAVESFDKALELDAEFVDAYNSKGIALYYMYKYEYALKAFDQAINLNSSLVDAYLWKAQVYLQQEKYDEAMDACDRGISRDKKSPEGYRKKSAILSAMNKHDEALDIINKAIVLDKDLAETYIDKAALLYEAQDYEECLGFCQDTLKKFPNNEDLTWYAADCYSAQYQHQQAAEQYEKVLSINPENDEAAALLGWEYFYMQDYEKAQKFADQAIEIYSEGYQAQTLQEELKKTKLPEGERIIDFVKSNYLYINDVKNFEDRAKEFLKDTDITPGDVERFINSIKIKEDNFTFTVYGADYNYFMEEERTNQVSSYQLDDQTCYVRIDEFNSTTGFYFHKVLKKIEEPDKKNLVIDLKGNAGGLIQSSNEILDYLLPECSTSYIIDRNGYIDSFYSDKNQIGFKQIVVLVDKNSASSAELLTLGLKKYLKNVTVIGEPTFGKGVGQNIYEDKHKGYMLFLVSFYWNVKEENIAGSKIYPDVKINTTSNESYSRAIKSQLDKSH